MNTVPTTQDWERTASSDARNGDVSDLVVDFELCQP
jgi:hypothetical protein